MKPDYQADPFFQYPRETRKTSQGDVDFPVHYYDVSNLIAVFRADPDGVESLLKSSGLKPALGLVGKPLVFLSFYEYRKTSIGSYNEVGVAIPVLPKGTRSSRSSLFDLLRAVDKSQLGFYVVDLPVTTEAANAAGREFWGYPKFVADIPFKLEGNAFSSEVKDPAGGRILQLSGKLNLGIKTSPLSAVTYSRLDGKTLRAVINVRGSNKTHLGHSLKLNLGDSQHRMAQNLRTLGLDNQRPLMVLSSPDFQSRLNLGAVID